MFEALASLGSRPLTQPDEGSRVATGEPGRLGGEGGFSGANPLSRLQGGTRPKSLSPQANIHISRNIASPTLDYQASKIDNLYATTFNSPLFHKNGATQAPARVGW